MIEKGWAAWIRIVLEKGYQEKLNCFGNFRISIPAVVVTIISPWLQNWWYFMSIFLITL